MQVNFGEIPLKSASAKGYTFGVNGDAVKTAVSKFTDEHAWPFEKQTSSLVSAAWDAKSGIQVTFDR